jgi:hypothetical protein
MPELPDFDPTTAYQGDYQWFPLIEDVTWEYTTDDGVQQMTGLKGRWDAPQRPDVATVGGGIGLSSEGPNYVVVWQTRPADAAEDDLSLTLTFNPKPGHVLVRETHNDDAGHAQRWVIHDATRRPFKGQWELLCDKEVINA